MCIFLAIYACAQYLVVLQFYRTWGTIFIEFPYPVLSFLAFFFFYYCLNTSFHLGKTRPEFAH